LTSQPLLRRLSQSAKPTTQLYVHALDWQSGNAFGGDGQAWQLGPHDEVSSVTQAFWQRCEPAAQLSVHLPLSHAAAAPFVVGQGTQLPQPKAGSSTETQVLPQSFLFVPQPGVEPSGCEPSGRCVASVPASADGVEPGPLPVAPGPLPSPVTESEGLLPLTVC
jgi:hypothetical protein